MKNIIHLLLIWLALSTVGCKPEKSDPCIGTFCKNGGTCVNGHCVCINDFTGTKCEIAPDTCLHINCGPHGTCVNGHCNCDINWSGAHCDHQITPIDSLLGSYHMTGTITYIIRDTSGALVDSVVAVNDTMVVTKFNDLTLIAYGRDMQYADYYGDTNYYNYLQLSSSTRFWLLGIKKIQMDSTYYQQQGGNFYTFLKGKRMQ